MSLCQDTSSSTPTNPFSEDDYELIMSVFTKLKKWRDESKQSEAEADTLEPETNRNNIIKHENIEVIYG